jgi:tRNA threonylcarbamoyladenosine biosynthesis protein TsaE
MIIEERSIRLSDADATMQLGARVSPWLSGGLVVTLSGELGAGKTTLVRGMLRQLGWTGAVKSPTYTLVEHYLFSSLYFYHFDFYRLKDPMEWETAGFSEYFRNDAVCVIEWPERVNDVLPVVDLAISLIHVESERDARGIASSAAGNACLAAFVPPG